MGSCFFSSADLESLSKGPLSHYRMCRKMLNHANHSALLPEVRRFWEAAAGYPYAYNYQPSTAALSLLARTLGISRDYLFHTELFPSCAPVGDQSNLYQEYRLLPVPIAAELIVLWEKQECEQPDSALAECIRRAREWLTRWGNCTDALFYREMEFSEEECPFLESVPPASHGTEEDGFLGAVRLSASESYACFSLSGCNSGLGVFRIGDMSVRAFGPQQFPLSDSKGFGIWQIGSSAEIERASDKVILKGWSRCYADPAIWLHLNACASSEQVELAIRWMGIEPCLSLEMPKNAFVIAFYVHAPTCTLEDGSVLQPNSLTQYQGHSTYLRLGKATRLECSGVTKTYVIPLAGFGCFWHATFLVAFSCGSAPGEARFLFRKEAEKS
jgi:hypothetical protein